VPSDVPWDLDPATVGGLLGGPVAAFLGAVALVLLGFSLIRMVGK
jgi:hypothetical protein